MSAYASLPGSFLPPFFAFGVVASATSENDDSKPYAPDNATREREPTMATERAPTKDTPTPKPPSSCTTTRSSKNTNDISPSAFKALALTSDASKELPSLSSPRPSDIIIAIQSARVDPVQLIKSLTSRGSHIARRTANFISRTPDDTASEGASTADASEEEEDTTDTTNAGNTTGGYAGGETSSVFSGPGLCYEDTDSDEEYSMYDYSDDFSSASNDDEDECDDVHNEEQVDHNSEGGDRSAIEFELSISFQGRKYNATRAFPTFVKLRNDLLREMNGSEGGDGEMKHGLHYRRSRRNTGGARGPIDVPDDKDGYNMGSSIPGQNNADSNVSIPELPRVSPESLGHTGYAFSGVARSGFALLQATAQHYCPEMECWMRQVIAAFPCSQSLSSFLWEPLSSSNANWETIGEGNELEGCNDENGKFSPIDLSGFSKPSQQSRSKSRSKPFSKNARYKSKGSSSYGSLNSIDEGNDCDDDDHSM